MASEFDFSELRNYLQGQVDLGAGLDEFYLDEPWSLATSLSPSPVRPIIPPPAAPRPVSQPSPQRFAPPPQPMAPAVANMAPVAPRPAMQSPLQSGAAANAPAPRVAKRSAALYDGATSLDDFYVQIKTEAVYSKDPAVVRYMGPANPKVLFLLPAVKPGQDPAAFFQSPVGEMLIRLFANLSITPETMGVSYFLKAAERPVAPLLETALKKMLAKELSLIAPQVVVTFGENLFHQLFGKSKNFDELAGTDLDFSGFKTCALLDPYRMVNDKQMKWLTWKVHIPRSTYFSIKQP